VKRPTALLALLLILAGFLLSGIADTGISIADTSIPDSEVASSQSEANNSSADDRMDIARISIAISIAVAIAVIYREFIHDWVYRPRIKVIFSSGEPISHEIIYHLTTHELKETWRCLRVKNCGRVLAWKCEAILCEVRNPKGELITRYEPLRLIWAISRYHREAQLLDIAPKRVVDLYIFSITEGAPQAFLVPRDPGEAVSPEDYFEPGDYWLKIVIYGDNFRPVEKGYAVHWDGKGYKGIGMQEMNKMPSSTSHWPWPILERTESSI